MVTGLAVDSRAVRPGDLFAALPGVRVHGARHVAAAIEAGAAAILTDAEGARIAAPALKLADVAVVVAEDPRQALAGAAALWFGQQPACMVAVTGTNGKTSVASFARQIWEQLGKPAVNLGTTGVEGAVQAPLAHTTPEPVTLHRVLRDCARAGVTHAAMEASSHGLAQRRLDGVHLCAAAFTNISQDHLDYHADFDAYFNAKAGLFTRVLPQDGVAVINVDTPRGDEMAEIAAMRARSVIRVGRAVGADLRITGHRFDPTGQDVRLQWAGRASQVRLALIGGFQAENAALAAALVIAGGGDPARVIEALPAWPRCAGACNWPRGAPTGRRCSSIMPIPPTRWPPRCRRCART